MLILKVNMFGACYFNTRRVQVSWSHPLAKSTRQATGSGKAKGRAAAGAKCQWPTSQPTTHNINIKWKARRERSRLSGNKLEGPRTPGPVSPCFPFLFLPPFFFFVCGHLKPSVTCRQDERERQLVVHILACRPFMWRDYVQKVQQAAGPTRLTPCKVALEQCGCRGQACGWGRSRGWGWGQLTVVSHLRRLWAAGSFGLHVIFAEISWESRDARGGCQSTYSGQCVLFSPEKLAAFVNSIK